jgi:hypothetical protein
MNLKSILLMTAVSIVTSACSQQEKLPAEYRMAVVEQIAMLVKQHYVFPEVGNETARVLEQQAKAGFLRPLSRLVHLPGN